MVPSALLVVDRPEDIGLEPDGESHPEPEVRTAGLAATGYTDETDWSLREAMGTKSLWVLVAVVGTLFMTQAGISVHVGAFFLDRGLSLTAAANAITLNAVVNAFASLMWGSIIERTTVRAAMTGLMIISGVCSLALLAVHSQTTAFAVASLFGIVAAGGNVIPPVAFASYYGRRSIGSIRGVSETGVQVGQTIGALFSGLVYDMSGSYVAAFVTFSALGLLGAVVISSSKPPVKRTSPDPVATDPVSAA